MHDSKVDFIERVKPIIKKIRSYIVNDSADDMKMFYDEIMMNPLLGWHLRTMLLESLNKMVNTIVEFVQDPKYVDRMDEIVDFHRDLGLSAEEVDEFEGLFLKVSIDEANVVVKFKEVFAQFKKRLFTDE